MARIYLELKFCLSQVLAMLGKANLSSLPWLSMLHAAPGTVTSIFHAIVLFTSKR